MFVHMSIYIYMCVCVCIYLHIHIYIHICMYSNAAWSSIVVGFCHGSVVTLDAKPNSPGYPWR